MADKNIGSLPGITSLDSDSLFVAEQQGIAVKVSGLQMTRFANVETDAQVQAAAASAQAAANSQEAASDSEQAAAASAQEAQAASQAVQDLSVSATSVPNTSPAAVEKTVDPETGVVSLAFSIPEGPTGPAGGVDSFNGRTGAVVPAAGDYTPSMVGAAPADLSGVAPVYIANIGAALRENLVANAYFVGGGSGWGVYPINQRGQLSYEGTGQYCIDGWVMYDEAVVTLTSAGLTVSATLVYPVTQAFFEALSGQTLTISAVLADGSYGTAEGVVQNPGTDTFIKAEIGEGAIAFASFTSVSSYQIARMENLTNVVAIKTEVGSGQTLYRVGNDGKAILLPQNINYAKDLLKLQQYFQLYRTQALRPAYAADCRPVMRIDPTPGTLVINGVTYYTNSAEL